MLAEGTIRAACSSSSKADVGEKDERVSTGEPCPSQNTADGRCDGKGGECAGSDGTCGENATRLEDGTREISQQHAAAFSFLLSSAAGSSVKMLDGMEMECARK